MLIYFPYWQKRIKHHQLWNESQSNLCNPALFQKLCWGALFSSLAGESWLGSVIQQQNDSVSASCNHHWTGILFGDGAQLNSRCQLLIGWSVSAMHSPVQYGNLHVFSVVRDVYAMDFIRLYDHMLGPPYVWFRFDFGKWNEKSDGYTQPRHVTNMCSLIFVDSFFFKHVLIKTHGIYPWLSVVVLDLLGISMEFPGSLNRW